MPGLQRAQTAAGGEESIPPCLPPPKNPPPLAGQSLDRFIYQQSLRERLISRVIPEDRLLQGLPFICEKLPASFTFIAGNLLRHAARRHGRPSTGDEPAPRAASPPRPHSRGATEHGARLVPGLWAGRSRAGSRAVWAAPGAGGRHLARAGRLSFWRAWSRRRKIMQNLVDWVGSKQKKKQNHNPGWAKPAQSCAGAALAGGARPALGDASPRGSHHGAGSCRGRCRLHAVVRTNGAWWSSAPRESVQRDLKSSLLPASPQPSRIPATPDPRMSEN